MARKILSKSASGILKELVVLEYDVPGAAVTGLYCIRSRTAQLLYLYTDDMKKWNTTFFLGN
jgi:hypothetical protein